MENQTSMVHKPNTTFMLTLGLAPDPQIPEGLYSMDHDHSIKITIKKFINWIINPEPKQTHSRNHSP